MSIPLHQKQAAALSPEAQGFLWAAPTIRLPNFLYRIIANPKRVPKMRAQFQAGEDKIEEQIILEHNLHVEHRTIAGVPVLVITPPQIAPGFEDVVAMNIHGGGFILGTARDRTALLTAAEFGIPVWSVEYSLSPEVRFPVAIEECFSVYREILKQKSAARLIGVSSSAGGQIILEVLLRAQTSGLPMPAALCLYAPAADISGIGDSGIANDGRDVVPFSLSLTLMEQNYLSGEDPTNPLVSPLYANYQANFPPTVISTGTRDLLLSSGVRLAWKLKDAGVEHELLIADGGWHGFNWEPMLPEAKRVREAVRSFAMRHLQTK